MKTLTLLTLSVIILAALPLQADNYREFTDKQGRTMKAELINVIGKQVRIKREDGATFNVDPSVFSKEDQEFIELWMLKTLADRDALFDISVKSAKTNVKKHKREGIDAKTWEGFYKVELTNESDLTLQDLKIEYKLWVFHNEVAGEKSSSGRTEIVSGAIDLPRMRGRGDFKFDTVKAEMRSTDLKSGYYWTGGGEKKSEDELEGFRMRIYYSGKLIYDWASPSNLKTEYRWPTKKK